MYHSNVNQLSFFSPDPYIISSEFPCIICKSDIKVINTFCKMPGEQFRRFVCLCEECRSKPWFIKE